LVNPFFLEINSLLVLVDRFRKRTIQLLSPFSDHQCEKRVKPRPGKSNSILHYLHINKSDRSWIRKTQVHPTTVKSSESERINHDTSYLFHANTKASSVSNTPQNKSMLYKILINISLFFFLKESSDHFLNTQSTSNIMGVINLSTLPTTNPTQLEAPACIYLPTPCMIRYRQSSLPTVIPTRIIKRPKSFDDSIQQSDLDHIDQLNA
jgi:hypothetical protein